MFVRLCFAHRFIPCLILILAALFAVPSAWALDAALWRQGAPVPPEGRANPYGLAPEAWEMQQRLGRLHALDYPVTITGLQIPEETLGRVFAQGSKNPILSLFQFLLRSSQQIRSKDDIESWLGLVPYPEHEGSGVFFVPFPDGVRPQARMGSTTFLSEVSPGQAALTYSCAACHAADFFGHKILGMTNRFPRANDFFLMGKQAMDAAPGIFFDPLFGVAREDVPILRQLKQRVRAIEGVAPQALGLDTSLALVGLSLSRRERGGDAAFDPEWERSPRANPLRHQPADSKPAVWWNVKYKNRWLSDGSVVSGNPIFTNFLWNEIGRGSDLVELEAWLDENQETMDQLTTAVFASQPPHWTDVFGVRGLDLESARRGQKVYGQFCQSCHGTFQKSWEEPRWAGRDLNAMADEERMAASKTLKFVYHEQTPVIDVGTDPSRALGMQGLLELNELRISKLFQTVIEPQVGYVPPPLLGIFARYPYLHNNSVPNLCELLTPASQRVKTYRAREARDPDQDFDFGCVGYPVSPQDGAALASGSSVSDAGNSALQSEKDSAGRWFRADREGLRNIGHDQRIFVGPEGVLWSDRERMDLIAFLKTL